MPPGTPSNPSKLKAAAIAIGVLVVIVLAFMFTITTYEAIPDRARFLVNTKERYVVPKPLPGHYIFHPLPGDSDEVFARFDASVTWGELRNKEHLYHGLGLPDTPEWDRFVFYGEDVSLFRSLFFPPPSRWDEQGRWRY